MPQYKKAKEYPDVIPANNAFMARVINGKLYTLVDKIKIPRKKVRVTEFVKEARKQTGRQDIKKVKKKKKKLLG